MNNQNNNQKNTVELFQYLTYKAIKESDADLSFFDFIQKVNYPTAKAIG